MHRAKYVICCIVATLAVMQVAAQHIPMLSRAALDSLVHPEVSAEARKWLTAERSTIDLGKIDGEERLRARFRIKNNHSETIAITALRSTGSCLKISEGAESIAPQSCEEVVVEFNPAGRNGSFNVDVLLYSSLDERLPSLRLTLRGEIESNNEWSHLGIAMGALRLSRRELTLDNIAPLTTRSERIVCANTQEQPLRIWSRSTIEGLTLHCEPEVLPPFSEGEIVVSYTGEKLANDELRTMLIIEGVECSPMERMIDIRLKNRE
jgi:hypothetical protein